MKILGFGASNSTKSINRQLVQAAMALVKDAQTEVIDLHHYEMPLYSPEREANDGYPQEAKDFLQKIQECDALIISFAEYNGLMAPTFMNTVDWASRVERKVFQEKPILVMSATPGGAFGSRVMPHAEKFVSNVGGKPVGTFFLPGFNNNFKDGEIINPEKKAELAEVMADFEKSLKS